MDMEPPDQAKNFFSLSHPSTAFLSFATHRLAASMPSIVWAYVRVKREVSREEKNSLSRARSSGEERLEVESLTIREMDCRAEEGERRGKGSRGKKKGMGQLMYQRATAERDS
jgi:hypothetical protein